MTNADGIEEPLLRVSMDTFRAFHYHVAIVEAPLPMFSGRMSRETDVYYRIEVFTQTGSGGYDLMGLTRQQVIADVLERYEAHLAFPHLLDPDRYRIRAHAAGAAGHRGQRSAGSEKGVRRQRLPGAGLRSFSPSTIVYTSPAVAPAPRLRARRSR